MAQPKARHPQPWTPLERQMLLDLYPIMGSIELATLMGRSDVVVRSMAKHLGARRQLRFTREEVEALIDAFPTTSNAELAKRFNRTNASIVQIALRLGLRKKGFIRSHAWSSEDVATLMKTYQTTSTRVLSVRLNRSETAIQHKALKMGLKKDPDSDLRYPPELVDVIRLQRRLERALNDREHDCSAARDSL